MAKYTVQIGHNVRHWTTYEIEGELTQEQVDTLMGPDEDAIIAALRPLEGANRLVEVEDDEDEHCVIFDEAGEPAILQVTEED